MAMGTVGIAPGTWTLTLDDGSLLVISKEAGERVKTPVCIGGIALDMEKVSHGDDGAWVPLEVHVWPAREPYLAMKHQIEQHLTMPDGTKIHLQAWRFLRLTPTDLRTLADAMERRQGPDFANFERW